MDIIKLPRRLFGCFVIEISNLFFYLHNIGIKNSSKKDMIWELLLRAKNPDSIISKFLLLKLVNNIKYTPDKDVSDVLNKDDEFIRFCLSRWRDSHAQLFQDLWILFELKEKRNGFFVEFGATDGISLSNTYLLEKGFNWNGILAEPCQIWQTYLKNNRNSIIDFRCIWSDGSSKIKFLGTDNPEFSTISSFSLDYHHAKKRQKGVEYFLDTFTLTDLLIEHNAPKKIDYLSIDTEGSEFEILSSFNFDLFLIKLISVEHNFIESKRSTIFALLSKKGYKRIFKNFSQFDDWYVHESICSQ